MQQCTEVKLLILLLTEVGVNFSHLPQAFWLVVGMSLSPVSEFLIHKAGYSAQTVQARVRSLGQDINLHRQLYLGDA